MRSRRTCFEHARLRVQTVMATERSWSAYPEGYRAREMAVLARWVLLGQSGAVVGLPGSGKSNLLGFLCGRAGILGHYEPQLAQRAGLIFVDLNNLPGKSLATFYRVILRSFSEAGDQFGAELQRAIQDQYQEARAERDPFLCQSALRHLLRQFQRHQMRIVLVFDRFDDFCQHAPRAVTDTMRGLRDSFKDTLSYIAGMRQEAVYLSDPDSLGELYELLDVNVCWAGALDEADGRHLIDTVTGPAQMKPSEKEIAAFLALSGGHPGLLKTICLGWLKDTTRVAPDGLDALLLEPAIRFRLDEIWSALSQEEQRVLSEAGQTRWGEPAATEGTGHSGRTMETVLEKLSAKGVGSRVDQANGRGWRFSSRLFAAFVAEAGGRSRGTLWHDPVSNTIFLGSTPLDSLAPLEQSLLRFLLEHPRTRHTYTELIEAAWPEEIHREGVTTEALYQVVRGIRRKVEPEPSQPHYIVNWRGRPEGGYQCFPEGRPG